MKVKDLKRELEHADDGDEVLVQFPDMGTGGYDYTDEVEIATEKGKVTIIAAIL